MEQEISDLRDKMMQLGTVEETEELRDALLDVVSILEAMQERIAENWREAKGLNDD